MSREHCLDLCQLYTEPVNLHLVVHAPYEYVVAFTALEERQ